MGIKKVFTTGRPPWYDHTGMLKCPLVIGVAGMLFQFSFFSFSTVELQLIVITIPYIS